MNEINKSQTRFIPLTPAEPPTENDKKNDLETISIKDDTPLLSDKDNNLYSGPLTKKILDQGSAEKLFSLLKQSKQEEFVAYFDTLSLTYQNDLINLDDGTSTMLQYACEKGLSKVVRYLLDRDVNIHLTTTIEVEVYLNVVFTIGIILTCSIWIAGSPESVCATSLSCDVGCSPQHSSLDAFSIEKHGWAVFKLN
jgi:hypothetical protein